jgi:hypothetical protein
MCTCSKSWPSDNELFQRAVPKAPNYKELMDLVHIVLKGMREKKYMDQRISEVLGYKIDAEAEWPTKNVLFLTAIAKLNSAQKYMDINVLQDYRSTINKGMTAKRNLDATIVQILDGTFAGDTDNAWNIWIANNPESCYTTPFGSSKTFSFDGDGYLDREVTGVSMARSGECSPDCRCPYDGPCEDRED